MTEQHAAVFDPDYYMYQQSQLASAKRASTFTQEEIEAIAVYIREIGSRSTQESKEEKATQTGTAKKKAEAGKTIKQAEPATKANLQLIRRFADFIGACEENPALLSRIPEQWTSAGLIYRADGIQEVLGARWVIASSYEFYNPKFELKEREDRIKNWDERSRKMPKNVRPDPSTRPLPAPEWLLSEVKAHEAGTRWNAPSFNPLKGTLAAEISMAPARERERLISIRSSTTATIFDGLLDLKGIGINCGAMRTIINADAKNMSESEKQKKISETLAAAKAKAEKAGNAAAVAKIETVRLAYVEHSVPDAIALFEAELRESEKTLGELAGSKPNGKSKALGKKVKALSDLTAGFSLNENVEKAIVRESELCTTRFSRDVFMWALNGHPQTWKPATDFGAAAKAGHGVLTLGRPNGQSQAPRLMGR